MPLTNILEMVVDVTSAQDNDEGLDMVFFDYKKAVNLVPHQRLVHKLQAYGFGEKITLCVSLRGNILFKLEDILLNRLVFFVGFFKDLSLDCSCSSYVNNLSEIVSSKIKMFAVDTLKFMKIEIVITCYR